MVCSKHRKRRALRFKNMANFVPFQYLLCHLLCADPVVVFFKLVAGD